MRFPDRDVTREEVMAAGKAGDTEALACCVTHWAYKYAHDASAYSDSESCALCVRHALSADSCQTCPLYQAGMGCEDMKDSPWARWGELRTKDNTRRMLNGLLTVSGLPTVKRGAL